MEPLEAIYAKKDALSMCIQLHPHVCTHVCVSHRYQGSPGLEPLEAIYAKKDVLSSMKQLGRPSKESQAGVLQALVSHEKGVTLSHKIGLSCRSW